MWTVERRDFQPKDRNWTLPLNRRRLRPEVQGLEHRLLLSGAGSLDSSFGTAGVQQLDFQPDGTSPYSTAYDVATDSAGNVVTVGLAEPVDNAEVGTNATVGRLTPAGAPDPTFHGTDQPNGTMLLNLGENIPQGASAWADEFYNIAQDSSGNILLGGDGDIVMVGSHTSSTSPGVFQPTEFLIMELSPSGGVYSENFNFANDENDGGLTLQFNTDGFTEDDVANAALYQPDGEILVSGSSNASNTQIPLARLDINGNLDQTFNPSGNQPGTELLTIPRVASPSVEAMAFQPSGQIILAGLAYFDGQAEALLVRLNSDDTIDDSFGTSGTGVVLIPSIAGANSMAVNPSTGQIIVAGSSGLAMVAANGSQYNVTPISGMSADSVALEPDGKIVVAGSATVSGQTMAALARFTASGAPDSSFGSAGTGLVTSNLLNGNNSTFNSVTFEPNGEIVAAGSAHDPSTENTTTVIARYIGEAPEITSLSPASIAQGGGAPLTLTVSGSDFASGSAVLWNGAALATTFVSSGALRATVPASDLAQPGTATVTVSSPGSITSNAQTFTIVGVPGVTGLSPSSAIQGGPSFSLTVTGDRFVDGAAVLWNGAALATAFVSSGALTATVPASDLSQLGPASVTVSNPGTMTSNAETFTVVAAIVPALPRVMQIAPGVQTKKGLTSIIVFFDQPMNPGSAMSRSNYTVFGAVKKRKRTVYTKPIAIRSVSYNVSKFTVTITLSKPYKGVVQATAESGIMANNGASTTSPFMTTVK
jgi:uncharacterized delta-60 repeat protein